MKIHRDARQPGQRVVTVDDLLATGGATLAAAQLVEHTGAAVASIDVLIELAGLSGRWALARYSLNSLLLV